MRSAPDRAIDATCMLDDAGDPYGAVGGFDFEANHFFEVAKQRFRGRNIAKFQIEQLPKLLAGLPIQLELILYAGPFLLLKWAPRTVDNANG
jgi:hypothetical protein